MNGKKFEIRRRYDATAKQYNQRYYTIQTKKYEETLQKIKFSNSDLILDVGGGTGLLLDKLSNFVEQIVCCDISYNMLLEGKLKHNNGSFVCADSDFLPFRNASFDKILCFSVLQNLPEPIKTVKELYRVLEFKGTSVSTVLTKIFTKNNLREIFEIAGFEIIQLWSLSIEDIAVIGKKNE